MLLTFETDSRGKQPNNFADGAEYINHWAYADDILIIGTSAEEIRIMYKVLLEACASGAPIHPETCRWAGTK